MIESIRVRKSDVAAVVKATFPNYSGRRFVVLVAETVQFSDLNWGGGTRNEYRSHDLTDGTARSLPQMPPWKNVAEGKTVPIPDGWAVVEQSYFCGRDHGLTIHVNPRTLSGALPGHAGPATSLAAGGVR